MLGKMAAVVEINSPRQATRKTARYAGDGVGSPDAPPRSSQSVNQEYNTGHEHGFQAGEDA
jgi:hypothetical protein